MVLSKKLRSNLPVCPFCGKEISIPVPELGPQQPYTGIDFFATYKTNCDNCHIEMYIVLDKDINLVQLSIIPFELTIW